ncbi:MAG TPA: hypothetical protein DHV36_00910 [Desulfobacteraceae bacterium]|nr:hypothetical protein [Desulfobacteraceae bacterium]
MTSSSTELSAVSQQMAANSEQTNLLALNAPLRRQGQVNTSATELSKLADHLNELMGRFTLN